MLILDKIVGEVPGGTVAKNVIESTYTKHGNMMRTIEFMSGYHIIKRVYTLDSGDVMTDVILKNKNDGREFLIYFKYQCLRPAIDNMCMLGDMSILSTTNRPTFIAITTDGFTKSLAPGEFMDIVDVEIINHLRNEVAMSTASYLDGIHMTWLRRTELNGREMVRSSMYSNYTPSKCIITDILTHTPWEVRKFLSIIVNLVIPYQHDYIEAMYDSTASSLVICNILGFVASRTTMDETELELELKDLCAKYNLNNIHIIKSYDESVIIRYTDMDNQVYLTVISIPIFVLTSFCTVFGRSDHFML